VPLSSGQGRRLGASRVAWVSLALLALLLGAPEALGQSQSIEIGVIRTGVLSSDDGRDPYRNNYADRYTLLCYAGQRLEILMTSDVIDTYLVLQNPAGIRLAEDDDSAGNLDSRIVFTAPIDGLYTIIATSYSLQEGPYELLVREYRPTALHFEPLRFGRRVHGALTETDASRSDNRRVDGYAFEGQAGDRIRLRAASSVFDTYIYLLAPTGEVLAENDDAPRGGPNSELSVELPATGEYRVLVTSTIHALGEYTVEVDVVRFTPIVDRPFRLGEAVTGRLEAGDGTWSSRGAYADGYTFEAQRGQHVEITMTSTELDSYLVLLDPDGMVIAENDDHGGSLDALISTRLASEGTHRILATSYSLAEGTYLLRARELELRPLERAPLRVGQTVEAELSEDDPLRHFDPAHMDLYALELALGQRIIITMRSDAFNSYLWVVAPSGEVLREDDDSGGGLDALVELTAPYAGTYLVVATTYAGLTGPYTLSVRDAHDVAATEWTELTLPQVVAGRLEYGDSIAPLTGAYRDNYRFTGEAGTHVEIRANSLEVDAMLALIGPSGLLIAEDDDSGGGLNALINVILPESGVYRLIVTSFRPAIGSYELRLAPFAPAPVQIRPLALGDSVAGELRPEDQRSTRYGTLVDAYRLRGTQGQRVRVDMTSVLVDPYLLLIDPNGEVIAEDDDGGGGLNARLEVTLPITGEYRILATSAAYGEGAYQLSVSEAPAVVLPDAFHTP
jgi:hypothetical protein